MNTIEVGLHREVLYKGNNALRLKGGSFVRVVDVPKHYPHYFGLVLMRTNSERQPFIRLDNGDIWSDNISAYSFETINQPITITQ